MQPFLKSVAEAYSSRYSDLSELCFIFPNKRSEKFFMNYLSDSLGKISLAPMATTITDFVTLLSGREVDSRLDLIFRLHRCYSRLCGEKGDDIPMPLVSDSRPGKEGEKASDTDNPVAFDKFRSWGEAVLSDFNEIDMQMVDHKEIFKNLKDFKEISSNFITPEQRAVMQDYFGYTGPDPVSDEFWKDFGPDFSDENDTRQLKRKFFYLWQVLAPLYESLHASLREDGLTTSGGAYRLAADNLAQKGEECVDPSVGKIVFVGFNALSRSEREIFSSLRNLSCRIPGREDEDMADFLWDADGPFFVGADNPAARFVAHNRKLFPAPEWTDPFMKKSRPDSLPASLRINAVPSAMAQSKVIADDVAELLGKISRDDIEKARVAIVLPDEKLLQPILFSIPSEISPEDGGEPEELKVNLTMGLPLKQTAVASFMSLLRKMQIHQVDMKGGRRGFLTEDVRLFLSHPLVQIMLGSEVVGKVAGKLDSFRPFAVNAEIFGDSPAANVLLRPLSYDAPPVATLDYMKEVLLSLSAALDSASPQRGGESVERKHVGDYLDAVRRLRECFNKYKVESSAVSVLYMAERLIANETSAFKGHPLEGLQIMGMLETRCLDFTHLFIPSLNEKIMPRRARVRTFIPNTIRYAYGMPPGNYQESIFAYYFFRLISRCPDVSVYYDSRTSGPGGEISRYILQLQHIFAKGHLTRISHRFRLSPSDIPFSPVKKTPEVMEKLLRYTKPQKPDPDCPTLRWNLSPSSISDYLSCPMKFFYKNVVRLSDDPEPQETVSPIETGHVIHGAMMQLYLPDEKMQGRLLKDPVVVTPEMIERIKADRQGIDTLVRRLINRHHFRLPDEELDRPLTGSADYIKDDFTDIIINILDRDLRQAPFRLLGCEIRIKERIKLSDGTRRNISISIDRLDRPEGEGDTRLRIVDYKTGKVHLNATTPADILNGCFAAGNIMQLCFYGKMFRQVAPPNLRESIESDGIRLEIYNVPKITYDKNFLPMMGKEEILDDRALQPEFEKDLDRLLLEMFDPDRPFEQTDDLKTCSYCAYRALCGR